MAKKWVELIVENECPKATLEELDLFYTNAPGRDSETTVFEFENKITGCRGITCEQCWNQESEEEC